MLAGFGFDFDFFFSFFLTGCGGFLLFFLEELEAVEEEGLGAAVFDLAEPDFEEEDDDLAGLDFGLGDGLAFGLGEGLAFGLVVCDVLLRLAAACMV